MLLAALVVLIVTWMSPAAFQPRRQPAGDHERRDTQDPAVSLLSRDLRDPRSGKGREHVGPDRGHEQGPGGADRNATACFIGCINLLEGRILENRPGQLAVSTALGQFTNRNEELAGLHSGEDVTVIIRPEAACLAEEAPSTPGREVREGPTMKRCRPSRCPGNAPPPAARGFRVMS
jgi:hypothetical protein